MADDTKTFIFPEQVRGVCDVCGAPAYHHMAMKCEDHRTTKKAKPAAEPTSVGDAEFRILRPEPTASDRPKAAPKAAAKETDKAARAVQLEQSILTDLNPVVLQGFAMLCKPIDPGNFYVVQNGQLAVTELGAQVIFSDAEAKILGKAAAELESSPIGHMATAAVGPVLPVAFGIAALGVVAFHGYRVMALRQQLLLSYNQQVQAANADTAGVHNMPPQPNVGDDIAAGFREADTRGFGTTSPNGAEPNLDFTAA